MILLANNVSHAQEKPNVVATDSDSSEMQFLIGTITIEGNQKTKDKIITRELTFKEGDCISLDILQNEIEQSRTNLLKLPLFNYVNINIIPITEQIVDIQIIVEERWFIWPQLSIINNERNFNTWWKERDFTMLDYRLAVKQYNVLGMNHILRLGLSYGYTREFSIGYQNISIDKKQNHLIGFTGSIFQYKSLFYRTFGNKQEAFTSNDDNLMTGKYLKLNYTFRPGIHSKHNLNLIFNQVNIQDTLIKLNPLYLAEKQTKNSYLEIQYHYLFDNRDSRSYPLNGQWFYFLITKSGLGFIKNQPVDQLVFKSTFKQFYQISKKFYGAHALTIKASMQNIEPYFFKESLGLYDYMRGFEYYVIEGNDFFLSKNVLKFELLPTHISYLNFIPVRKFKKIHYAMYLNTYFDLGYAHEKNAEDLFMNNLSDRLLYSGGFGFDFVTYYDKVLRLEYSINNLKESGFFIHFLAPI